MNFTLLGEMLTFAVLVWVTMKYIWPPLTKVMELRQKQIADGLAAGERGTRGLELAKQQIKKQFQKAKMESANLLDQTNKRVAQMIEEAKKTAAIEAANILAAAKSEITIESEKVKQHLREELANLVIAATSKVLQSSVDRVANHKIIDNFIEQLEDPNKYE